MYMTMYDAYLYVFVYANVCVQVCMCVQTYVFIHVNVCIYMCVFCMYAYMHVGVLL